VLWRASRLRAQRAPPRDPPVTSAAVVDRIRALPREKRLALYRALPPGALASQRYAHKFWARPEQLAMLVTSLATIELITGGRGSGKTWLAVALFLREILAGRAKRLYPRIIAATDADALGTVIDGPSGIRTWCPPEHRPKFYKSRGHGGVLVFNSVETEVQCLSAEKPSQAIGEGSGLTLYDDPAKAIDQCGELRAREMLKQARISNREGPRPSLIIPTTPRGDAFLRQALTPGELTSARITYIGELRDNTALSEGYKTSLADLEAEDPGEFDGRLRHEAAGALWRRAWIDATRVLFAPELARVVVSVDTADDDKKDSDETGIVVIGQGDDGRLYVLADYTGRHAGHIWPALVAWAFKRYKADAIVVETNRGAGPIRRCMAIEAPNLPIVEVQASRGKATRAEPLALQYKAGMVSHVKDGPQLSRAGKEIVTVEFYDPVQGKRVPAIAEIQRDRRRWQTLDDELCGWVPRITRSPNGLDALVWAAWHLLPPESEGFAAASRFAGIGAVEGKYHEEDARNIGVGGVSSGNADPRWER
jgi:phage terminase large subunit-like protein